MVRFRDILKNRNFLFFWLGQVVSNFGERLSQMALIAVVYKKAPGSTLQMAKLLFFTVIPVFIVGPIAGVYVDRWDRKRTMVISNIFLGILVLTMPFFILFFKSLIAVYVIVFLVFAILRFFFLSRMAVIPDIVPKDMLLMANTFSDMTRLITGFIGIGIAGIFVERLGAIKGFYINAATYLISAVFISRMAVKEGIGQFNKDMLNVGEVIKKAIKESVWSEIVGGIKYIVEHKEMRFVTVSFFVLMGGAGVVSCVLIVFVQEAFGSVTKDLSILLMFAGLGAFIGAMSYGRFGQRFFKEKAILICMLLSGLFIALFAVIAHLTALLWLSCAAIFLAGLWLGPVVVSLNTIIHELIPQETRGRIFSSNETIINLGFLVFMFIAAFFAEHVGKVWILISCGVLFSFWGATGYFGRKKKIIGA